MFRNAEYVIALKKIMQIRGMATLQDYKDAFQRLDEDNSGYIELAEVETLLNNVYKDRTVPEFEVSAFMKFFDKNKDGKISWEEFERGLGTVFVQRSQAISNLHLLTGSVDEGDSLEDDDDNHDEFAALEPEVSGVIEIELQDGKVVEVDAKEYVQNLKNECRMLKETLQRRNKANEEPNSRRNNNGPTAGASADDFGSISSYITSRQGDVKGLTEGISPEIVETMKMLVDYVLEGGDTGSKGTGYSKNNSNIPKEEILLEIPGSALQQLALWQLILGYRLRESEAKGDYLRLLD